MDTGSVGERRDCQTISQLADTVLPLIRTRADVHRWSAANAHGSQMHEAIDLLEAALPHADPADVYAVTHKALASAVRVIARADDSSGIIGDACRRLLDLHPKAAKAAVVPPGRLVDWMIRFQFDGDVDYFDIDPVAYAPALGEKGMASYRARLDAVRAQLGPQPSGTERFTVPDRHQRWILDWNDRRLAVLDQDVEAIIRTHAQDQKVAAWLQDTAQAFAEIGDVDHASGWARQAMDIGPRHQSLAAADYWCTLLAKYRPEELLAARLFVFRRWPSLTTATRFYETAGTRWPTYRGEVLHSLSGSTRDAVMFALSTLDDVQLAWQQANAFSLDDDRTWSDLAQRYETVDRLAVLPVHRRLVENELVHAGAKHYRIAARRLARMRHLAAGSTQARSVDELIAELRNIHQRRPRPQQEFDRAGLP